MGRSSMKCNILDGKKIMQEMNAVLDAALDELDDDCKGGACKSNENKFVSKAHHDAPSNTRSLHGDIPEEKTAQKNKEKRNDRTDEDVAAEGKQHYQPQTVEDVAAEEKHHDKPQTVEEALGSLLEEMNRTNIEDLGQEDDFLREMLGMSDGGTENFDADAVIDGMMEQMLSKELMYEPMKQVLDKFPDYLDENKGGLSKEEYTK